MEKSQCLQSESTRRQYVSVGMLLDQVDTSDEHLEANLCTMLQSVRGMY